jgi:hypothetical protein
MMIVWVLLAAFFLLAMKTLYAIVVPPPGYAQDTTPHTYHHYELIHA